MHEDIVSAIESGRHELVIGGKETGVSEATTDVLLEAAWFDPLRIATTQLMK